MKHRAGPCEAVGRAGALVTGEPGLPVIVAGTGELADAAPEVGFAGLPQPAAPATTTAVIAAKRARRIFHVHIEITRSEADLFPPLTQGFRAGLRELDR